MVFLFWLRMGILFFAVSIASTYVPLALHLQQKQASYTVFVVAFVVAVLYWRGQVRLSNRILRLGKEKFEQKRYGDARTVLEYFHRVGNMGFDVEGEAHYYLVLVYIGLDDLTRAESVAVWLRSHRSRYAWAEKAARPIANAQRKRAAALPPVQSPADSGADAIVESDGADGAAA